MRATAWAAKRPAKSAVLGGVVSIVLAAALTGCGGDDGAAASADTPDVGLSTEQRARADALVSIFENGEQKIRYDYAENLDDGRGITAGRAGFTTATGDLVVVVEKYTEKVADNPLARYLPELRKLAEEESDDTSGLDGLIEAWGKAAKDGAFRDIQDDFVDSEYFTPAMEQAEDAGLELALSRAILYDTNIQHGSGEDPDGLPALIKETTSKMSGSPADGVEEEKWISTFLTVRRDHLADAAYPDTREEWAESVGRVDALKQILDDGNVDLDGPVEIHTEEYDETVP
jgi:chitosanase